MQTTTPARVRRHAARLARAARAVSERLEERRLLAALTPAQVAYTWEHLNNTQRNLVAVTEYLYPEFAAQLSAALADAGLPAVTPQPGSLPAADDSTAAKGRNHHRPPHPRLPHPKPHRRHHGKTGPTAPVVTNVNYYYDQALPNQIALTFDQDVTASNWNSAVSVLDLNTGATIPASGTYASALHTIVYNLNSSTILPNANYAAILHGSQVTDTTNGLSLVGSDSLPGHDYAADFFFLQGETSLVPSVRAVGLADYTAVIRNFGTNTTYSGGNVDYIGSVDINDYTVIVRQFGVTLPLLATPGTPTAWIASSSSADLFWDAPASTLVTHYDVYRDSARIASDVTDTGYLDAGLALNTTYAYFVVGKDASGNSSFESPEAFVAIAASTPTLSLAGDATVTEGDTYYLAGAFGNANNDEPTRWNISWGDGTSATYDGYASAVLDANDAIGGPAGAFHTYSEGTYTITGSALSDIGTYAANPVVVTVTEATPTFSVLGDPTYVQGQPYTIVNDFHDFDAPTSWSVAWGDGSSNSTGSGAIPATLTHTYATGATAPRTLTAKVVNADGTYTNTTSVDAAMPTLSVAGASSTIQDGTYTLTRSFSDPAGLSPSGWTIAWGDGSTTTAAGSATTFTHAYTQPLDAGEPYTLAAYATDANGTYYAAPATVTITPATPTVSIATYAPATVGATAYLTNLSTNPGGNLIQSWTIAWGDGASSFYTGNPPSFPHVYNTPGARPVTATATTPYGTYAQALTFGVADSATLAFGFINAPVQNRTYNLPVNFAGAGAGITPSRYVIAWGDGTSSTYGTDPDYAGVFQHVYHTYGTLTLSAEVDAGGGTYTHSATQYVQPNVSFSPSAPYLVSQGAEVQLLLNYDGTDPVPEYTVNWSDGTIATSTARTLTHTYNDFEPHWPNEDYNNYNPRSITVSAIEGTATYTGGPLALVYRTGTAVVTPSGPTTASEGTPVVLSATFSDDHQHSPWLYGAANWSAYVNKFGNGADYPSTRTVANRTLTFPTAGTYHVQWTALYEDDDSYVDGDGIAYVLSSSAETDIVVTHTPGTATVGGDAAATLGQPFALTASYSQSAHIDESVQQWTIDWGDGKSSVYYPPHAFSHNYETTGSFSIVATALTNEGTYTATRTVSVAGPAVSLSTSTGVAYEQGQTGAYFVVSRSVAGDQPLAVNFATSGTVAAGDCVITDAATGQILTDTVTIPANARFATLAVIARDDNTPEWTETLNLTLTASAVGGMDASHGNAATTILDNDLRIRIDNGSDNAELQGSKYGDTHLVTLQLTIPPNIPPNANITLTELNPKNDSTGPLHCIVRAEPNVGPSLINELQTSYTWSAGDAVPPTLYLGMMGGSEHIADIQFSITVTDPTAPIAARVRTATSNFATSVFFAIMDLATSPASDISTGKFPAPIDTLVGQFHDLDAVVIDPYLDGKPYWGFTHWNIPGNRAFNWSTSPPGSVSATSGTLDPLPPGLTLPSGTRMGYLYPHVQFFWISTDDGIHTDTDEISTTYQPRGFSRPITVTTQFDVYEPIVDSSSPVMQGTAGIVGSKYYPRFGLMTGVGPGGGDGIYWTSRVDLPPGNFGPSTTASINFAQKILSNWTQVVDGVIRAPKYNGEWVLDNFFPSETRPTPFGRVAFSYLPGSTFSFSDAPGTIWTSINLKKTLEHQDLQFQTYLMFKPPGNLARYVPLRIFNWSYQLTVRKKGNIWVVEYANQDADPTVSVQMEEPQWMNVTKNGDPFTPVL